MSPSSRRAWIEILAGYVKTTVYTVALLAEGVDRNLTCPGLSLRRPMVALLAEGVDRNNTAVTWWPNGRTSPSSRRAWIEIFIRSSVSSSNDSRPPRGGRG